MVRFEGHASARALHSPTEKDHGKGTMSLIRSALALSVLSAFAAAQGTDTCTTPTPITGNGPFAFNNAAATNTTGAGTTCAGLGRDLFWVWTAPAAGAFDVSTCGGAAFDTVIAVYAGATCPSATGAALSCVDDSCGLQSTATFTATAGTQYLIRVGSYNGGTGGSGNFTIAANTGGGGGTGRGTGGFPVPVEPGPESSVVAAGGGGGGLGGSAAGGKD